MVKNYDTSKVLDQGRIAGMRFRRFLILGDLHWCWQPYWWHWNLMIRPASGISYLALGPLCIVW